MTTINLGKYRPTLKGSFVDGEYKYLDMVTISNVVYMVTDKAGTLAGETPLVSGKWEVVLDGNSLVFNTNELAVTDNTGKLTTLPLSAGVLTSNGLGGLIFAPRTASTVDKVRCYKFDEGVNPFTGCFIGTDDKIYVIGSSYNRFTGIAGTATLTNSVLQPNKTGTWEKLVTNAETMVAITSTGEMWIMGDNAKPLGGFGTTGDLNHLTKCPIANVKDVSLRGVSGLNARTLVIKNDGTLWSSGYNVYSQLGRGVAPTNNIFEFHEVTGFGGNVVAFATDEEAFYSSMAVLTDEVGDNLYTWGRNANGEQGLGHRNTQHIPVKHVGLGNVKRVATYCTSSSFASMSIVKSDGTIWGAGHNRFVLGDSTGTLRTTWTQAGSFSGYVDIAGDDTQFGWRVGITADKMAHTWGINTVGQLGIGSTVDKSTVQTETTVVGGFQGKVSKVLCRGSFNEGLTLIVDTDGQVWHSGYGGNFQSGDYVGGNKTSFHNLGLNNIVDVKIVGGDVTSTSYAIDVNGVIYAWGHGALGKCGNGTVLSNRIPREIL